MSIEDDVFKDTCFGKAALAKIGPVKDSFRFFQAGFIGDSDSMRLIGAEFREAKTGPNKGKRSVIVEGTKKTVVVYQREIAKFKDQQP